jgi:opacity protein-like surface antigen
MGSFKSFALAGVFAVAASASSLAADLLPPPPMAPYAPPPVLEASGWYLRGDVGVSSYDGGKFSSPDLPPAQFFGTDLGAGAFAGVGVGYQFNSWLRADVTGDYRGDSRFDALSSRTRYTEGYSQDRGKLQSSTLLLNGYIDLGTWGGITPYVGAGIGVAQNRLHNYSGQVVCLTIACGDPTVGASYPLGPQPKTFVPTGTRTNLAWALMAGASMELMPGVLLDAGYRYVNLGEARTKLDQYGVGTRTKDLRAHEIRLGVRYMID